MRKGRPVKGGQLCSEDEQIKPGRCKDSEVKWHMSDFMEDA